MIRLFVAVDPAEVVRDRVRAAMERVRPLSPRARWVDPAGLHVTLAFLGDTEEARVPEIVRALSEAASGHGPIDLAFAGAGTFGGRRPRVLWAGVGGAVPALAAVNASVARALAPFGYAPDHDSFTPHLTLARAGDRGGDPGLGACAAAMEGEVFGEARIEGLVLYQSDRGPRGARYTALSTLLFTSRTSRPCSAP